MKKLLHILAITAIALFLFPAMSSAQKSGFVIGGGVYVDGGFNNTYVMTKSNDVTTSGTVKESLPFNVGAGIQAGYVFKNNIRIELLMGYEHQSTLLGVNTISGNLFSLGPQVSYLLKISDGLYYMPSLALQAGRIYATDKINDTTSQTIELWTYAANLSLIGFEIKVVESISVGLDIFAFTNNILTLHNEYSNANMTKINWQGKFAIQPVNLTLRYYI